MTLNGSPGVAAQRGQTDRWRLSKTPCGRCDRSDCICRASAKSQPARKPSRGESRAHDRQHRDGPRFRRCHGHWRCDCTCGISSPIRRTGAWLSLSEQGGNSPDRWPGERGNETPRRRSAVRGQPEYSRLLRRNPDHADWRSDLGEASRHPRLPGLHDQRPLGYRRDDCSRLRNFFAEIDRLEPNTIPAENLNGGWNFTSLMLGMALLHPRRVAPSRNLAEGHSSCAARSFFLLRRTLVVLALALPNRKRACARARPRWIRFSFSMFREA